MVKLAQVNFLDQKDYSIKIASSPLFAKLFFLNFNLHAEHHVYPAMPCYHIQSVKKLGKGIHIPLYEYIQESKYQPGTDSISQTTKGES